MALLTDGADDASVAGYDWLLVDVQQAEVLQEGVGHGGVQLLLLDEGVGERHDVRVPANTGCERRGGEKVGVRGRDRLGR